MVVAKKEGRGQFICVIGRDSAKREDSRLGDAADAATPYLLLFVDY